VYDEALSATSHKRQRSPVNHVVCDTYSYGYIKTLLIANAIVPIRIVTVILQNSGSVALHEEPLNLLSMKTCIDTRQEIIRIFAPRNQKNLSSVSIDESTNDIQRQLEPHIVLPLF